MNRMGQVAEIVLDGELQGVQLVAEPGFPTGPRGAEERGGFSLGGGEIVAGLIMISGRDETMGGEGGGAGELAGGFRLSELLRGPLRLDLGEISAKLWGLERTDVVGEDG